jgi:GTP cyclohydrolase I
MYCSEIFEGLNYANFPKCTTIENRMGYDEIVCVRNNIVRSTCEHHLQPIYGRASIAYIPNKKVLGLSKFARVVDFFASRPQVQERFTEQVYAALSFILDTEDIAVLVEADHFCMKMRGVEEYCSDTVTSKMGGRFRTNSNARREVLTIIGGSNA